MTGMRHAMYNRKDKLGTACGKEPDILRTVGFGDLGLKKSSPGLWGSLSSLVDLQNS